MPVPARITEDKFSDGYSFEERELRPLLYECLWEIDYAVSNYIWRSSEESLCLMLVKYGHWSKHKGSYTRLMSIMLIVDTNPSEHYGRSGYKPRCPYWVHLLLVVLITKFMEQGSCKHVQHDCLPSSGINQFFTCIIFCLWLSKASCNVRLTWLDDSCCRQSVENVVKFDLP